MPSAGHWRAGAVLAGLMEREGGAARPELCVGAIVVVSERLLLVQRARPPGEGQWSIPGGRVESGETMAAAVEREVLEETGLSVVTGELVGWAERLGRGYHFVIFDFRAEPAYQGELPDAVEMRAGLPEVTPGDDARAVAWVAGDELESLELVDGLAGFFTDNGVVVGGHLV